MTVLPDGTKEPLHGHNYYVHITVHARKGGPLLSFSILKRAAHELCERWEEKILLPQKCSLFSITRQDEREIDFTLCNKRYVLPSDEVVLLPVDNVTTEALAEVFCWNLVELLRKAPETRPVVGLEVRVDEFEGQGASFAWTSPAFRGGHGA